MTSKFLPLLAVNNCYLHDDQKIWKAFAHFLKVAQKVSKEKKAKVYATKLNLKAQNIYIKPLLKP